MKLVLTKIALYLLSCGSILFASSTSAMFDAKNSTVEDVWTYFARFLGTLKREIPEESVQGIFD